MRQIREILRLKHEGLDHRAIARACGVGVGTVSEYLRRGQRAGLAWPLPPELDETSLEARLFPPPETGREQIPPDLIRIHQELKRPGVTLHLLWEEYREVHPAGYGYSHFCEIYRRWAGKLRPSMRQHHRAGEKTFIDFSGKQPHLVDRSSCNLPFPIGVGKQRSYSAGALFFSPPRPAATAYRFWSRARFPVDSTDRREYTLSVKSQPTSRRWLPNA